MRTIPNIINFNDINKITINDLIKYLEKIRLNSDNCEYLDSWNLLWDDIVMILDANKELEDEIIPIFTNWFDNISLKCSLYALQKVQILRYNLLKLLI